MQTRLKQKLWLWQGQEQRYYHLDMHLVSSINYRFNSEHTKAVKTWGCSHHQLCNLVCIIAIIDFDLHYPTETNIADLWNCEFEIHICALRLNNHENKNCRDPGPGFALWGCQGPSAWAIVTVASLPRHILSLNSVGKHIGCRERDNIPRPKKWGLWW